MIENSQPVPKLRPHRQIGDCQVEDLGKRAADRPEKSIPEAQASRIMSANTSTWLKWRPDHERPYNSF